MGADGSKGTDASEDGDNKSDSAVANDEVEVLREHAFTPAPSKGWTKENTTVDRPTTAEPPTQHSPSSSQEADDLVLEELKLDANEGGT